ncbi:hypothetical protein E2986_12712 [Frieseomelitta varia]|uniref:Uncharacterized protein n=1 Tax=Frieseomelitta varia TaxID=561572 RepID=A0A833S5S5_9HYME|nr:hypothetical protein E2986_12712 [Frieseomelitta varia]
MLKYTVFLYHSNDLKTLVEMLWDSWRSLSNEDEQQIILKYAEKGKFQYTVITQITESQNMDICESSMNFYLTIIYVTVDKRYIRLLLLQALCVLVGGASIISVTETTITMITYYITGLFKVIQYRMRNVFNEGVKTRTDETARERLIDVAKMHMRTIHYRTDFLGILRTRVRTVQNRKIMWDSFEMHYFWTVFCGTAAMSMAFVNCLVFKTREFMLKYVSCVLMSLGSFARYNINWYQLHTCLVFVTKEFMLKYLSFVLMSLGCFAKYNINWYQLHTCLVFITREFMLKYVSFVLMSLGSFAKYNISWYQLHTCLVFITSEFMLKYVSFVLMSLGSFAKYNINWYQLPTNSEISLFETNIRFMGSLLACYALTGDVMFREKAAQLGERMLPAFQTETGIPHSLINLHTGASKNYGWASSGCSILSEIGTMHLEFTYLSDITGNPVFKSKVENVRKVLKNLEKPKGLYPNYIHPKTGKWGQRELFFFFYYY